MHTNGKVYDFNNFKRLENLTINLYHGNISIEQARSKQYEMQNLIISLKKYRPQIKNKIKFKIETLSNAEKLFNGREIIINAFENGIFPLPKKLQHKEESEEEMEEQKDGEEEKEPPKNQQKII